MVMQTITYMYVRSQDVGPELVPLVSRSSLHECTQVSACMN